MTIIWRTNKLTVLFKCCSRQPYFTFKCVILCDRHIIKLVTMNSLVYQYSVKSDRQAASLCSWISYFYHERGILCLGLTMCTDQVARCMPTHLCLFKTQATGDDQGCKTNLDCVLVQWPVIVSQSFDDAH